MSHAKALSHFDNVDLQLTYLRQTEVAQVCGSFTPLGRRTDCELFDSIGFYKSLASERICKSHQSLFRRSAANAASSFESTFSCRSEGPLGVYCDSKRCTLLPAKSNSYCLKHHLLTMKFLVAPMAALAGMASLVFAEEVRQNEKRRAREK
jgi:hypothetical protein